ncbi:MAG: autotransporter outer membrane beta-barrel domain-containing protein [Xanthomonadales bacterium]|nr:autotransporter outer membrane beta-barrel domain-containing protein [Xanthomonadales bacterium]
MPGSPGWSTCASGPVSRPLPSARFRSRGAFPPTGPSWTSRAGGSSSPVPSTRPCSTCVPSGRWRAEGGLPSRRAARPGRPSFASRRSRRSPNPRAGARCRLGGGLRQRPREQRVRAALRGDPRCGAGFRRQALGGGDRQSPGPASRPARRGEREAQPRRGAGRARRGGALGAAAGARLRRARAQRPARGRRASAAIWRASASASSAVSASAGCSEPWSSRTRAERRFLADAGRADSRERSLSLFLDGTPAEGWGVNLYAGHGDRDLDLERRIAYTLVLNAGQPNQSTLGVNALAVARPDGGHTRAGAALERNLAFGATSLSLRLASDWSRVVIEPFVESGGAGLALARGRNRLISHTVNLGLELAHAGSFGGGVFQPYLRATLLRELRASPPLAAAAFAADPRRTPIVFERDALDRSYAEAALGAVTVFGGGWSAFAELEGLLGNRDFDQFLFSAGARRSF